MDIPYTQGQRRYIWLSESLGGATKAFENVSLSGEMLNQIWEKPEEFRNWMQPVQYKRLMRQRSEAWIDSRIEAMAKLGVRAVCRPEEGFPDPLRFIPDPPAMLYVKGTLPEAHRHIVGIVGTRRPSRDGLKTAADIARGLSDGGVIVVSGLAGGIDAAAHQGCMEGASPTVAVLGFGHDQRYPAENQPLFEKIVAGGGALVSEYPPGTLPLGGNFVRRNRLISGFASGCVLVEGSESSGGMITMKDAARQGRMCFAVPGSIYQINSQAPNALLKEGAHVARCAQDILDVFGWNRAQSPALSPEEPIPSPKEPEKMEDGEDRILRLLAVEDLSFGDIALATGQDAGSLAAILTMMEIKGRINALPGKMYRIAR